MARQSHSYNAGLNPILSSAQRDPYYEHNRTDSLLNKDIELHERQYEKYLIESHARQKRSLSPDFYNRDLQPSYVNRSMDYPDAGIR